jgi:hypothetical protein
MVGGHGEADHPTDWFHIKPITTGVHEPGQRGGRESTSFAKKAEASFRISFARRNSR